MLEKLFSDRKTELILDTPKTKNSIREIPMSRDLLRMLKPLKKIVNNSFFILTTTRSLPNLGRIEVIIKIL
jgi:hypothetical protein